MSKSLRIITASDLHQSESLYLQLGKAVEQYRPDVLALVGDFLDVPGTGTGMLSVPACAEAVAKMRVPEVVAVRGNHEDWNFLAFEEAFTRTTRQFRTLHGEAQNFGPMTMIGFPTLLGDETAFTLYKPPLASHPDGWLPQLIRKIGPRARTFWAMHEPPAGTPLSVSSGPLSGNCEWTDSIHRFSPWLVVCGHDHLTPERNGKWSHRLGDTIVVNVGQSDGSELHYAVIEAEFDFGRPSLPRRMTVTAHPWNQSFELPFR